jgi:hypothetical protein
MTDKATAEALHAIKDQYLECRDLLHAWRTIQDFQVRDADTRRKTGILRRLLECDRCGTQREDLIWLRTFERLSSRYIYPDDYRAPGHHRGITAKTDIRAEVWRRAQERNG